MTRLDDADPIDALLGDASRRLRDDARAHTLRPPARAVTDRGNRLRKRRRTAGTLTVAVAITAAVALGMTVPAGTDRDAGIELAAGIDPTTLVVTADSDDCASTSDPIALDAVDDIAKSLATGGHILHARHVTIDTDALCNPGPTRAVVAATAEGTITSAAVLRGPAHGTVNGLESLDLPGGTPIRVDGHDSLLFYDPEWTDRATVVTVTGDGAVYQLAVSGYTAAEVSTLVSGITLDPVELTTIPDGSELRPVDDRGATPDAAGSDQLTVDLNGSGTATVTAVRGTHVWEHAVLAAGHGARIVRVAGTVAVAVPNGGATVLWWMPAPDVTAALTIRGDVGTAREIAESVTG